MQTEPIQSITIVPTIEATQSRKSTTQDGLRPAEPSILDGGGFPANGDAATQSGGPPHPVRNSNGGFTLPGERIAAYENAATPITQHTMGFKVMKRSGPLHDGPSLTDCPNGACSKLLSAASPS